MITKKTSKKAINFISSLCLVLLLPLISCGQKESSPDSPMLTSAESIRYSEETTIIDYLDKTPTINTWKKTASYMYCEASSSIDGNKTIVRASLDGVDVYPLELINDEEFLLAYDVYSKGETDDVILLTYSDKFHIKQWREDYGLSDVAVISFGELNEYPFEIVHVNEDNFLFLSSKNVYIFNTENGIKKISCPGEFFVSIISSNKGTYVMSETKKGTTLLSRLDISSGKLELTCELSFKGLHAGFGDKGILITDGKTIFSFSYETQTVSQLYDLSEINLRREWIKGFFPQDGKLFLICDTARENNIVRLIVLTPQYSESDTFSSSYESPDNTIKIYCPYGAEYVQSDLADYGFIDEFLVDNPDYSVEILSNESEPEAVFLNEKCPDIVFFPFGFQENYIVNGYLCDLSPYITDSQQMSIDNFLPAQLDKYKKNGKLYALPQKFHVQTLVCKKSYYSKNGWDLNEFIAWIDNNSPLYLSCGLSKQSVLQLCLDGIIAEYVDSKNKTAIFDSESFVTLIERINNLKIEAANNDYISLIPACFERPEIFAENFLYYTSISSPGDIALMKRVMNDELSFVGYPGMEPHERGKLINSNIFGVYVNARNKDAAYQFIEYCLCKKSKPGHGSSACSSVDYIRNANMASSIDTINISYNGIELSYEVTNADIETLNNVIDNASSGSNNDDRIKAILIEELTSLFENEASAQKIAKVIQSRVNIILSE